MRVAVRIIVYLLVVLAAASTAGLGLLHRMLTRENLKERIEESSSAFLQRKLTIGELNLTHLFPTLLTGADVRLADSQPGDLVTAPSVTIKLFLGSIPRLAIGVREMRFLRPVLHVRRGEDGEWNLHDMMKDIGVRSAEKRAERRTPQRANLGRLYFNRFVIEDGRLDVGTRGGFRVNGQGRLQYAPTQLRFPFALDLAPVEKDGSPLRWNGVAADLDVEGALTSMSTSTFRVLLRGATTQIEAKITLPPREGPRASPRPDFIVKGSSHTETAQIVEWWRVLFAPDSKFRANGRAQFSGHLNSVLGKDFLPDAAGQLSLAISDGTVWNMPVMLKTLSEANVKSLVNMIRGEDQEGVPFNSVKGKLEMREGKISTVDPLVLESDTLQMSFSGVVNALDRTIDGRVLIGVVTLVDEVIQQIPLVRDLLLRKNKSFVPISVRVKGPWSNFSGKASSKRERP